MKPQKAANTHVRFLLEGLPKSKNETKLTAINTTKLIFMLTVGDILFVMNVAKSPPGIVMRRTSMKTSPDMVPLKPSSTRNVTATVVKELIAAKPKYLSIQSVVAKKWKSQSNQSVYRNSPASANTTARRNHVKVDG